MADTAETEHKGQPIVEFPDPAAWEAWLMDHHGSRGVWIKHAKRAAPTTTVTHAEALEIAICFGWIDAQRDVYDEHFYLQRFTPRTSRSRWSQVNCQKATALIEAGRMQPAGIAAIDAAKADGRWEQAYEPQSRATVPPDFQAALDENEAASKFFQTLTGARRYAFVYRLTTIKRPETRVRRIEKYVALLAEGKTLHD
jgi:uncharacterized protein YdeI (YjbR/CyaY-like superfamily)